MGVMSPPTASKRSELSSFLWSRRKPPKSRSFTKALKEGGSVELPLSQPSGLPLFGMCPDKFGVSWMVGCPRNRTRATGQDNQTVPMCFSSRTTWNVGVQNLPEEKANRRGTVRECVRAPE